LHRRGEVVDIQAVVFDHLFAVELEKEEREKYGRGLMTDKEWYVLCTGIRFIETPYMSQMFTLLNKVVVSSVVSHHMTYME